MMDHRAYHISLLTPLYHSFTIPWRFPFLYNSQTHPNPSLVGGARRFASPVDLRCCPAPTTTYFPLE